MGKTQEVELRVLLDENQHQDIISKLQESGAVLGDAENVIDEYFCDKYAKSFQDVEMNEVGSYSLRLRQKNDDVELNMKIITSLGDHHAWEEHELKIDSMEEAHKILEHLGQKSYIRIEKTRQNYVLGEMLIILEDIKDFGLGLEIEIMTEREKTGEAKEKIKTFLNKIGVGEDKIVPKSITNIIMHQKARF